MSESKQCIYCGRKGTRWFVIAPGPSRGWWCKSARSCNQRREAQIAPVLRRKRKAPA